MMLWGKKEKGEAVLGHPEANLSSFFKVPCFVSLGFCFSERDIAALESCRQNENGTQAAFHCYYHFCLFWSQALGTKIVDYLKYAVTLEISLLTSCHFQLVKGQRSGKRLFAANPLSAQFCLVHSPGVDAFPSEVSQLSNYKAGMPQLLRQKTQNCESLLSGFLSDMQEEAFAFASQGSS